MGHWDLQLVLSRSLVMGRALKRRARAGLGFESRAWAGPGLEPFPEGRASGRAGLGPFTNLILKNIFFSKFTNFDILEYLKKRQKFIK